MNLIEEEIGELKNKVKNYELAMLELEKNDYEKAIFYFKSAIEPISAMEKYNWGVIYFNGEGVEPDCQKAIKWFDSAAKEEYADAERALAYIYVTGKGCPKNEKKAIDLFKRAYIHGKQDSYVLYILGQSYIYGLYNEIDVKKGINYLIEAAQKNDGICETDAQILLANLYFDGIYCEMNEELAKDWAEKASNKGNIEALQILEKLKR